MGTLHRTEIVMYIQNRSSPVAQKVKNLPAMWETWIRSLGWEDPLEKGRATHSTILAWRQEIPCVSKESSFFLFVF